MIHKLPGLEFFATSAVLKVLDIFVLSIEVNVRDVGVLRNAKGTKRNSVAQADPREQLMKVYEQSMTSVTCERWRHGQLPRILLSGSALGSRTQCLVRGASRLETWSRVVS
jgi:hypothetical protein